MVIPRARASRAARICLHCNHGRERVAVEEAVVGVQERGVSRLGTRKGTEHSRRRGSGEVGKSVPTHQEGLPPVDNLELEGVAGAVVEREDEVLIGSLRVLPVGGVALL